jgi:TolB protein
MSRIAHPMTRTAFLLAAALSAAPAFAQQPPQAQVPPPQDAPRVTERQGPPEEFVADVTGAADSVFTVAVPVFATPQVASTAAGSTATLGQQIAQVVVADLSNSRRFRPNGPAGLQAPSFPQVQAPAYSYWQGAGADNLIQGYVQANADGTLTVGCYLYDVSGQTQLARQGFQVAPSQWRRAAHRCADSIYSRLSGDTGFFDTRVVYVAESGPPGRRVKRLAMMDYDGANHRFLTNGQWTVLTPRFAPDQRTVAFMSYENERPRVWLLEMGTGRVRPLVQGAYETFAPRYSPDSRSIVFSMAVNGNTDIYRVPIAGGQPQRLTNSPGIDTGGSYSPDGSKIVFESDRGGTQQVYVMNADGSDQRRISFGGGGYATPEWSPRGDLIAFTRTGSFRIGVMNPDGSGQRILTGDAGEGPTWAPNGRAIMYQRGLGRAQVWYVDVATGQSHRVPTPLDGSDPSWSRLQPN